MRTTNRADLTLATVLLLVVAACQASGSPSEDHVPAGIPVVHNTVPALTGAASWHLSEEPTLQIGESSGDPHYLLDDVGDVLSLPDGRWVVANRGDNTLRFYSADGRFLNSVGGTGDGPGEFKQIMGLYLVHAEIWVMQFVAMYPIHVFDLEGNYLRTLHIRPPDDHPFLFNQGVFPDGTFLSVDFPQGEPVQPGVYGRELTLLAANPDSGKARPMLADSAIRYVDTGSRRATPQVYGPSFQSVAASGRLYTGWPEDYTIEARGMDATPEMIIKADVPSQPVTAADRNAYEDKVRATAARQDLPDSERQPMLDRIDKMVYPKHHPAYQLLRIDVAGNLWVERWYGTPDHPAFTGTNDGATWDVFSPEGKWITTLTTPPRLWPRDLGADHVAGVWIDDLGVHTVRVYALIK